MFLLEIQLLVQDHLTNLIRVGRELIPQDIYFILLYTFLYYAPLTFKVPKLATWL